MRRLPVGTFMSPYRSTRIELKITWVSLCRSATLLSMDQRGVRVGRPRGATTADPVIAQAFGAAVRSMRTTQGMAQETLANEAGIERSHLGKIERGEHMPTLALVFKISRALKITAGELVLAAEALLPETYAP